MATILIVDDEKVILSLFVLLLKGEGYTWVTACNGQEALLRLTETKVDLIISNYLMPKLDGLALLKHLRGDDAYKQVPIIMNSVRRTFGKTALAEGANAFFSMPTDVNTLLTLVSRCLEDESLAELTKEQTSIWDQRYQIDAVVDQCYEKFYSHAGD